MSGILPGLSSNSALQGYRHMSKQVPNREAVRPEHDQVHGFSKEHVQNRRDDG
jgi:hypothetical protein